MGKIDTIVTHNLSPTDRELHFNASKLKTCSTPVDQNSTPHHVTMCWSKV